MDQQPCKTYQRGCFVSLSSLLFFLLPVAAMKSGLQNNVETSSKFWFEIDQPLQE
jgi:hypothetical protein